MDATTTFAPSLPTIMNETTTVLFSWYDYILFATMLAMSAGIGIYFGCFGTKQSTADEYLMGNKRMKVFPVAVSMVASHISGITLLAIPSDIYRFGTAIWAACFSIFVAIFVMIYIFMPVFYKLQITSSYEYLEKRFDQRNRTLASFLFALGLLLYLPIVIYIPALAFSAATGISVHYITSIVCGVCIFYTTLGGLKAVVWTDTLQFIITVGALVTVCIIGMRNAGGFVEIWKQASRGERLNIFNFDFDLTKDDSFWNGFIGLGVLYTFSTGLHQSCVQKFLAVETFAEIKRVIIYHAIGVILVTSCCCFMGLIMYAKYATCDPFTTGAVERTDQLLPYFVMDVASHIPGLPGLFVAGIFCAGLSTLSAHLNCFAGAMYEDFISKWISPGATEEKISYILKATVAVTGILCTLLVYVIEHLGGILPLSVSFNSVATGPLLGTFTLGALFPQASSRGAFFGTITGLLVTSWIVFTAQYYKAMGFLRAVPSKPLSVDGCKIINSTISNTTHYLLSSFETTTLPQMSDEEDGIEQPFILYRLSVYYYALLGLLVTIITGLLWSIVLKNNDPPVSRDVLSPAIYCFLSENKMEDSKEDYSLKKLLTIVSPDKK